MKFGRNSTTEKSVTYYRCHAIIAGFAVLIAALLLVIDALSPADRSVLKVSGTDSVGYFGTAHSLLFDFDFDLTNEYATLHPTAPVGIRPKTGLPGSPWPIGYSLLQIPFLALGTFVDYLAHNPPNGYSRYALTFYYLGNVVFMAVGLVCLFQFLYLLTRSELPFVPELRRQWTCLGITLLLWPSTTLGYYTFSPMSHVAGFMAVTLMIRVWWHVKDSYRPAHWGLLGLTSSLMIMCRWQNALLLLWPFLYDSLEWIFSGPPHSLLKWPWLKTRSLFVVVAVTCLFPQFIQWKMIYGSYLINPQGSDFLQFPPRFFANVLLSTRHGWFTWTPLVLVCVIGLFYGCYKAGRVFIPLTTVLFLEVAVIGSIPTNWHLAESFGMRGLTCTLAIPGLGLAWLLFYASPRNQVSLWVVVASCTIYGLIFAVQYRMDLLPKQDWLTSDELVNDKIFLKQAYERQRQVQLATTLLHEGRLASSVSVLQNAERQYGDSRFLLEILTKAYKAMGREEEAERTRLRLQALLDRRLY